MALPDGLKYLHPQDDWFWMLYRTSPGDITLVSGTPDPDFPVANLGDGDPSNPFKTTSLQCVIRATLPAAADIGLIAIIHSNLQPTLSGVRVTSGAFTSDDIDIPDEQEDGFPTNALLEFPEETGTVWDFEVTSDNDEGISIGELVLARPFRVLDVDFQLEATDEEDHPTIDNESELGAVTASYETLVRSRGLTGSILLPQTFDTEPIVRWQRAGGWKRPFLIDPRLPIAEPWYVNWPTRRSRQRVFQFEDYTRHAGRYPIAFTERGRGLAPEASLVAEL